MEEHTEEQEQLWTPIDQTQKIKGGEGRAPADGVQGHSLVKGTCVLETVLLLLYHGHCEAQGFGA